MKKRYNLIVREYNKMDISKIEEYTIQVETDDIDFTIEQLRKKYSSLTFVICF